MTDFKELIFSAFQSSADNTEIIDARFPVLKTLSISLHNISKILYVSGYIQRSDNEIGAALLAKIGSELSIGIAELAAKSLCYSAAALLRQLVEVEYIAYIGYLDIQNIGRWYLADKKTRRNHFSPQNMRRSSNGLFRDQEYATHCEIGGHPHPKAGILLGLYETSLPPIATLLPDSVHHARRLWNSVHLFLPKLPSGDTCLEAVGTALQDAISNWERLEDPTILSFDGLPHN